MKRSGLLTCLLILILAPSVLQAVPVKAQAPDFAVTQVYWGTSTAKVQAKPGDKNALLNIEVQNIDTVSMTSVTAKLYLTNTPFTTPTGEQYAYAGTTSISAGSSATFSFRLNIDQGAALKTYELTMDLTMVTTKYPSGVTATTTVSIPLYGEVRFSTSLNPERIQPGSNNIKLMLVNEGEATATDLKVKVVVPSPLVVIGENPLWRFSRAEPSEQLTIDMKLYASSAYVGKAYSIIAVLTYSDGYGYARAENVTAGLVVSSEVPSSLINIDSYALSPETIYKGDNFILTLNLRNFGNFDAEEVTVELTAPSLFASLSPSLVSLGKMEPGSVKTVTYELAASPKAESGVVHSFTVDISYVDSMGNSKTTTNYLGVPLHGTIELVLYDVTTTPAPAQIGRVFTFSLTILNRGTTSAMYTNLSVVPNFPFQPAPGGFPYIGELDPNAPAPVSLSATVDPEAEAGVYTLNLMVYYRDEYNQPHTMTQPIQVQVVEPPQTSKTTTPTTPSVSSTTIAAVGIVAVVAVVAAFLIIKRRRKESNQF